MKKTNLALLAAGISLLPFAIQAQTTSTWTSTTAGAYNWDDAANWTTNPTVPNTDTFRAAFNNDANALSGIYDVTLATDITLGRITFTSTTLAPSPADTTVNLLGAGTITLNDSTGTNQAFIQKDARSPLGVISNNIILADADGVSLNGNVALNGIISGSSTLNKVGSSATYLGGANTFTSNVNINGGALIATNTAAFSGASAGTYTFGQVANASIGSAGGAVTTVFNNAIVLTASSFQSGFLSGGAGNIFEITTSSITDQGTNANARINIGRVTTDANYGVSGSGTGTVRFTGTDFTVTRDVNGGANTSVMELSPASGTQTWSGNFIGSTGSANIVKSGAGTVIIGQSGSAHTYASQTRVDAGTLILNGTFTQTATGGGLASSTTGRFQVETGATLQVAGTINVGLGTNTNANNAMLVKSGGTLAPGANGIGALVFDGAGFGANRSAGNDLQLNMATGSSFAFEVAGDGGTPDRIDFWSYVNGDALFNSNAINLTLTGPLVADTYTVDLFRFYSDGGSTLTASGISSGLTVGTLGAGIDSASIIYGTNTIQLQYSTIPEPGTLLLVGLALGSLLLFRRRG